MDTAYFLEADELYVFIALMMCTEYTLLGALLAVLVFSLTKSFLDALLKPSITQSSNPYVLLELHLTVMSVCQNIELIAVVQ